MIPGQDDILEEEGALNVNPIDVAAPPEIEIRDIVQESNFLLEGLMRSQRMRSVPKDHQEYAIGDELEREMESRKSPSPRDRHKQRMMAKYKKSSK